MKKTVAALLILFGTISAQTNSDFMSVSEIKPGMRGIGKTVFAGDAIEEFDFEVLDIVPNFYAKRELILVKLLGEKVQHTNVVHGMSGSPMYIHGKLVGALAYRMGIFLKDPIGGITPIAQMLDILEREKTRGAELASNRGLNTEFLDMAVGVKEVTLAALIPPKLTRANAATHLNNGIAPLKLPLFCSGFNKSTVRLASQIFGDAGFELYAGGGVQTDPEINPKPLQPGSAYSIVLVDGDWALFPTGTVTYINGSQVIGMGHPIWKFGAVNLPMGKAKIVTTLSSLMASTKMAALTGVVGTIHQDRVSGVMGVAGETPNMIPVDLRVKSSTGTIDQFNFRVAEDRSIYSFTPIIFSIVTSNALESARMSSGNQTLKLHGQIKLKGHEPVPLRNYFAGGTPSSFLTDAIQASGQVASTLGSILSNDFESPDIESVELNFEILPRKQLALIQRLEVNKTVVRRGETVRLTAYIREFQGKEHKVTYDLKIPERVTARRITIFAGSGATLTRLEARNAPQRFRPKSFRQLTKLLNEQRKNNFIFFQIRQPDQGIIVKGQELPGLPPSVLSVIRAQKSSGKMSNLRDRVLLEESVQTEFAVSGGQSLWLTVKKK